MHRDRATLDAGVEHIRESPREQGTLELICRRPATEEREVLAEAMLSEAEGLVGDNWRARGSSSTEDGSAHPDTQLTLMNVRSASLIASTDERRPLAGDQLYVDLDLSEDNLPPGTRIRIGEAVVERTAVPHRGCGKFQSRFGVDALKFVNSAVGRELNLRGVNTKVVTGGAVRTGDPIEVLR